MGRQFMAQILDVSERDSCINSSSVPENTTRPFLFAGPETEIDDVVGHLDHVGVVFDHGHGVALIAQLPEDVDEPQVVARVQTTDGSSST